MAKPTKQQVKTTSIWVAFLVVAFTLGYSLTKIWFSYTTPTVTSTPPVILK